MAVWAAMDANHWNACLELLSYPFDGLDPVRRTAAMVFYYDGQVQNGGHSLHFDFKADEEELLRALEEMGAHGQARILAEARYLKRGADEGSEDEDYAAEAIEDLDRRYYALEPDIPALLAAYFEAHPGEFPR
jgi:hypothetical protein